MRSLPTQLFISPASRITCGMQLPDDLLSRKDEGGVFRPADEHLQTASTISERSDSEWSAFTQIGSFAITRRSRCGSARG